MTNVAKLVLIGGGILFLTKKNSSNPGYAKGIFDTIAEGFRAAGKAVATSDKGQSFVDAVLGPSHAGAVASSPPGASSAAQPVGGPGFAFNAVTDGWGVPSGVTQAMSPADMFGWN